MLKTLMVGIDGASWDYLNELIDSGQLPVLQTLISSGARGILHSTLPAHTPTAWGSIISGKNPGKHGSFDFIWRIPGTYQFSPTNAQKRFGSPFWKYLNDAGIRVGLVNVPFTHPPDSLEGFVVSGFGAPESVRDVTHPPDLLAWIEERFGPYQTGLGVKFIRNAPYRDLFQAKKDHEDRQVQIALTLAQKYQVDVLAINLMLFDFANHKMPEMHQIHESLRITDNFIQRLIEGFSPDNILLFSDHGSRRIKGEFLLNIWLQDQGFSVSAERTPAERDKALNWVLMEYFRNGRGWKGLPEKVLRRFTRETLLRLPHSSSRNFWNSATRLIPFAEDHVYKSEKPDFGKSQIFMASSWSGLLYVNIAGREPAGMIPAEDRLATIEALGQKLLTIEDPALGKPLISKVYQREEIYSGSLTKFAPDVILDHYNTPWSVVGNPRRDYRASRLHSRYFVTNPWTFGVHSRDGLFVFSGTAFKSGADDYEGYMMDIPATLLYLYDVPIPDDYDGKVLNNILDPGLIDERSVRYQMGDGDEIALPDLIYSKEEEEQMFDQLRMLGYVD